tara:strand:+ start:206 stop:583 length:378 start_codon:yes stop_codon:yes gene_type:complete
MPENNLKNLFDLRFSFMQELEKSHPGSYPEWPLEISSKQSQQVLRDTALKGIEEMFEALQHLKNWKPHRSTDMPEFDREEFLEEVVDAFNYFLSVLVLVGVDSEEFYEAYEKKDKIIRSRLLSGY